MESTDRPMRRKDRQLSLEEAYTIIRNTAHAVIATADGNAIPYAFPISFTLHGNYIVFHGAADPNGRKWINLNQNPRVSITFVGSDATALDELPGNFSINYASAIVDGTAFEVTDEMEKKELSRSLAEKYVAQAGEEAFERYYNAGKNFIRVWKIRIDKITGKARNKHKYFDDLPPVEAGD